MKIHNRYLFAMRLLMRDWRSGEIRLLVLALVIAVAAVSSVGFFTDRIDRAMTYQAAELLAADMQLRSRKPIPEALKQQAIDLQLNTSEMFSFSSVVIADNDQVVFAQIKAVAESYPLRGLLRVADQPYGNETTADSIPKPGEVWVEPRLLMQLDVGLNEYLSVGSTRLRITKVITHEPDRGGNIWQTGPRVLLNSADLEATGLIGPLSRVRYIFLIAGDADILEYFKTRIKPDLPKNVSLQTVEDARPEIRSALDRARLFLGLAVIVAVILAGAAIAVSARHFSERQADACSIMKSMGASQAFISEIFLIRMIALALLSSLIGCIIGFLAQLVLSEMLKGWFLVELPSAGVMPLLSGLATGLVVLMGFALPPIMRLKQVPPLKVIRNELGVPPLSSKIVFLLGMVAISGLIYWQAQQAKMAAYMMAGILIAIVVSALLSWGLLKIIKKLPRSGAAWRYGLSNLLRRKSMSTLQLIAFSLSIMALLLLTIVRNDLLQTWKRQLPDDMPNHFLFNIQPSERETMAVYFKQQDVVRPEFDPIVVARLTELNGKALDSDDYESGFAKWVIDRDQRLSYNDKLAESNSIIEGKFWASESSSLPQWSLEKSFSEGLDLKIGDELTFKVSGIDVTAPISSFREVQWDSMQANFYVLGSPGLLEQFPASYITSFYLPDGKPKFVPQLIRQFPGVSVIDVRAIIKQVKTIMDRATLAIEYIFGFTLCACLLVLYATINASREVRRKEASLLRALGASRKRVLTGFAVEFLTLGLLAGLLGSILALVIGYYVATNIFNLEYQFNFQILLISMSLASVVVCIAGIVGTRKLVSVPPMRALTA